MNKTKYIAITALMTMLLTFFPMVVRAEVPSNNPGATQFSFAAVGGQDYRASFDEGVARQAWVEMINDINTTLGIDFTIHIGDTGHPEDGTFINGELQAGEVCNLNSNKRLDQLNLMKSC